MSVRESIATNLVTALQAVTTPTTIKFVTREPFDFDKLSNAQYPAVLVRTTSEDRGDSTVGGSATQRLSTIDYELVGYVKLSPLKKSSMRTGLAVAMLSIHRSSVLIPTTAVLLPLVG